MKIRIQHHTGTLNLGYSFNQDPTKQTRNYAEFNVTPAELDLILMFIDPIRVSIQKRYSEYQPQLSTF